MVVIIGKDVLRYIIMEHGELFVKNTLTQTTLKLYVQFWDTTDMGNSDQLLKKFN